MIWMKNMRNQSFTPHIFFDHCETDKQLVFILWSYYRFCVSVYERGRMDDVAL